MSAFVSVPWDSRPIPLADLFRYAWPVVRHAEQDLPSPAVEAGRDPDVPSCVECNQRLLCVYDQVGQHLVDLVGVGGDKRQVVGQIELDVDVC